MTKVIRAAGWTLIASGVLVLLYLVYLLFWTGRSTAVAQDELLERWETAIGQLPAADGPQPAAAPAPTRTAEPTAVALGDAFAAMWFERPGAGRILHERPLLVVEGVTLPQLRKGPGHYPGSDVPGGAGNFAVSGHRTTYGAPFYDLDQLRAGDEVHVVDRDGAEWVYEVVRSEIVAPTELWVVGDDPLGNGAPTLTLTTCHPRFSAAQRLIVFAQLVGEPAA